jgi:pyruvate dehydrogenase E1 component beta subunit
MAIENHINSKSIQISYREALKQGLQEVLRNDDRVFLMGEDVGHYGGAFAVSKGLLQEFGEDRIMDVPLSESGFVGAGIGAAITGMKPIVEVMTINFSLLALDQIVNNAATLLHMSGIRMRRRCRWECRCWRAAGRADFIASWLKAAKR